MRRRWIASFPLALLVLAVCASSSFADPAVVYVDDGYGVGTPGWNDYCFQDIQPAIDRVANGGRVDVYPGTYNRDEANGWDPMTGLAGSNDFNIFVNKGITIQGVTEGGVAITDYHSVAAFVIAKRALPTFGESGIFVQADGVTITGLDITGPYTDNNKNLETGADNLTVKYCQLHARDGASALYISDWHFVAGPPATSHIQTYRIEGNYLNGGGTWASGLRIANGAGWTGDVSGRVITGNTFYNNSYGIEFVGPGNESWDVYPVGAATITGNTFTMSDRGHVTAWGEYLGAQGYADPDWASILTGNTFEKAAVTWTPGGQVRSWDLVAPPDYNFKYVRGIYSGIQRYCLNRAAQPGDRVQVLAGIYEEQLDIAKALTLDGNGAGSTVIQSPATLTKYFTTSANNYPIVYVHGADGVVVKELTVDGLGRGNANPRFYGVAYYNAGGTIQDCEVKGVRNSPIDGAQHGVGIYAYTDVATARVLNVTGCTVYDYQKNAMALNGAYLTAHVDGCHVTGYGPASFIAQNGIQLGYGATGTVGTTSPNIVAGHSYTPAGWAASGILIYQTTGNVQVKNNTVSQNSAGIYCQDTSATVESNAVTATQAGTGVANYWGVLCDPGGASSAPKPQPYDEFPEKSDRTTFAYTVNRNVIDGDDGAGSVGLDIWCDGTDHLTFVGRQNTITDFGYGVNVDEGSASLITSVLLNWNSIYSNVSYGLYNNAAVTVDARYNWWGAADGPNTSKGSGDRVSTGVTYDPWIGKAGSENVVCVPDPQVISLADAGHKDNVVVTYLGGGSGPLYGYSIDVVWTPAVVSASFARPDNGPFKTCDLFMVIPVASGHARIDVALGGTTPGTSGAELFKATFTAVGTPDYATSPVTLTLNYVRDGLNHDLTGFYDDDGQIIVDLVGPSVAVAITNPAVFAVTGSHEWFKDGDNLTVTGTVTDGGGLASVVADLSQLGGDPAALGTPPSPYVWPQVASGGANSDRIAYVTATDAYGNITVGHDHITADNLAPDPVAGFAAAPGNEKVHLSWTDMSVRPDQDYYGVKVQYRVWGDYPEYDPAAPLYPGTPTDGDGTAFFGDAASATHTMVDARDIYYYSAFVCDWALNYSTVTSAGQDRATNYWLGDVASPWGFVFDTDVIVLGGTYGVLRDAPFWVAACDVGPTDDYSRLGIPLTDGIINFEDLMIFAMNYGVVTAGGKVIPLLTEPADEALALSLQEVSISAEGDVTVAMRLEGNVSEVKGISTVITYDPSQLEFVSARLADGMVSPLAEVFFWHGEQAGKVQVDLAMLGTGVTIGGSGEVAVLAFRALAGEYALAFDGAALRGAENEDLTAELQGLESRPEMPTVFRLVQNVPNPFNPVTTVKYEVPFESDVTIQVYDVAGREVRTLVDGSVPAGRHQVVWDGRNDAGESVGSGVYFCTMNAPNYHGSQKMMLLK
jgi:parallel beta-helix repeat protein